ncbi:hypothetical protein HW555_005021 [Spodoptera exigua]|uniref:MADF domain-containing protein n=1 Tax=Spodoptera exigua TaxID=7107 RepID=A0A835LBK8_SPOEX|nr:hypothetical protein HW555_005021 [Spodoptera exigua]
MAAKIVLITDQDLLLKVIAKYRELPVLWDMTHKQYHNRDARKEAYELLLKYYTKYDEAGTLVALKKKIENMRAAYKREKKKVDRSIVDGQPYTPSLWYYSHLKFLDEDYITLDYDSDSDLNYEPLHKKVKTESLEEIPSQDQNEEDNIVTSSPDVSGDDESAEAFGKSITCMLKELPKLQRCLAEKLIGEVMFFAKMDKLNMDSMIYVNSDGDNSE